MSIPGGRRVLRFPLTLPLVLESKKKGKE